MTEPVHNNTPFKWFEKNGITFSKAGVIVGLALFFIGMGAMSAALATPSSENFKFMFYSPLEDARVAPDAIAAAAGSVSAVSACITFGFSCLLYRTSKTLKNKKVRNITKEEAAREISRTKWQNLGKLIGFAILMFGVGMIISSGLVLDHSVSVLKGMPTPMKIYPGWEEVDTEKQILVSNWVSSSEKMMAGMVTIGTFITVGGCALILSMGGFATLRALYDRYRKREEENITVTAKTEDL